MKKIKIAFIKFGGLALGGTEKFIQTIAAKLPKEEFEVDYFYTNAAPYLNSDYKHAPNDEKRADYLKINGVNVIPVNVQYKNIQVPTHDWINTNFWNLFDESKYDIIQTGRAGHPEYPFTLIKNTAIVDSLHLIGHNDFQKNIEMTLHTCQIAEDVWVKNGGDKTKVMVVDPIMEFNKESLKKIDLEFKNKLKFENKFVFGMHQRDNDGIYSPMPLEAYKMIENDNTAYVLLGGSKLYREQAKRLNLKNFKSIDHSSDTIVIYSFLNMLDVFAHGRHDGENNSQSMAEAMYFKKPILSNTAESMGHVAAIGNAGFVCSTTKEYSEKMSELMNDKEFYEKLSKNAKTRFDVAFSVEKNMEKVIKVYRDIITKQTEKQLLETKTDEEFWDSI